jgi:hypothetical protein
MKTLPEFIELRRDMMARDWIFICRACGIKERYHQFWNASRAAHGHAEIELEEMAADERRGAS